MGVKIVPKGASVPMPSQGPDAITQGFVGVGWDIVDGQSNDDFDLDLSLLGRDRSGDAQVACYYGELNVGWARHEGDNRTGKGDGDDEKVHIDFTQIPPGIHSVDVLVTIHEAATRNHKFGAVENAFARIVNPVTGAEIRTDLSNTAYSATGVVIARFVRDGAGAWMFVASQDENPVFSTLESAANALVPA